MSHKSEAYSTFQRFLVLQQFFIRWFIQSIFLMHCMKQENLVKKLSVSSVCGVSATPRYRSRNGWRQKSVTSVWEERPHKSLTSWGKLLALLIKTKRSLQPSLLPFVASLLAETPAVSEESYRPIRMTSSVIFIRDLFHVNPRWIWECRSSLYISIVLKPLIWSLMRSYFRNWENVESHWLFS